MLNYDFPRTAKDYIHRVGRTARAGRAGSALSFVTEHEILLVEHVESKIGEKLKEFPVSEAKVLEGINAISKARVSAQSVRLLPSLMDVVLTRRSEIVGVQVWRRSNQARS